MSEHDSLLEVERQQGVDGLDFETISEPSDDHLYEEERSATKYIDESEAEEEDFAAVDGEVEEVLWDDTRSFPIGVEDEVKVRYRKITEEYSPEKHLAAFEEQVSEFLEGHTVFDVQTHVVPEEDSDRHRYEAHITYRPSGGDTSD